MLVLITFVISLSCIAQTKKAIIAAQDSALDSLGRIAGQQHMAILKATEHIENLNHDLSGCQAALMTALDRFDSLRTATRLAYNDLLRERDALYLRQRTVTSSMVHLGQDLQGYTCVMPFTSMDKMDTLALTFSGTDLLSSVINFRIINWRGVEIYKEPIELLKQEEISKEEEIQRLLIASRILAFFQDNRFHYTSTGPDDNTWSFTYSVNEQHSRTVAFSQKQKAVVRLDHN